eukprot:TRINITY_DN658_c0_g1_i7.p2 TRINITY_DN658_c0_g1~~TRINITY_DN658_c0_g1_i7.p2  ORF type:complete len:216 (-),score=53.28 TRINITY_DN658_c0_g1_i7:167-814(-)
MVDSLSLVWIPRPPGTEDKKPPPPSTGGDLDKKPAAAPKPDEKTAPKPDEKTAPKPDEKTAPKPVVAPKKQAGPLERSGPYGGPFGDSFEDTPSGPVTAIRVRSSNSKIASLQLRYGDAWGPLRGNENPESGKLCECVLQPGEGIVLAKGSTTTGCMQYVETLILTTTQRRLPYFGGGCTGKEFVAAPTTSGNVLVAIGGRCASGLLTAITFVWQ